MGKNRHGFYRRVGRRNPGVDLKNHVAHRWEFADEATRLAASGFTLEDQYHMAKDADTDNIYVLIDPFTPTWKRLNLVWVTGTRTGSSGFQSHVAASNAQGSNPAWKCFDNSYSTSSSWRASSKAVGQWVRWNLLGILGKPVTVTGFRIAAPGASGPRQVDVQVSQDGSNFTTVASFEIPQNTGYSGVWRYFDPTIQTPHNYVRLYMPTKWTANDYTALKEVSIQYKYLE